MNPRTPSKRKAKGKTVKAFNLYAKHPNLWKGFKSLIYMRSFTRKQALDECKKAAHYYDGTYAWKAVEIRVIGKRSWKS